MKIYLKRVPNPMGGCVNDRTGERCYFYGKRWGTRCAEFTLTHFCPGFTIYLQVPAPGPTIEQIADRFAEKFRAMLIDELRAMEGRS